MKILIKYSLLFIVYSMLLASCEPTEPPGPDPDPYISATIDGMEFRTNKEAFDLIGEDFIVAELTRFNGFVLAIGGVQLNGEELIAIGLGFGFVPYEDLEAGLVLTNGDANADEPFAVGTYQTKQGDEDVINSASDEFGSATVRVTSIDKERQLISGEFEFVSVDEDLGDERYQVSNGVFENIHYNLY